MPRTCWYSDYPTSWIIGSCLTWVPLSLFTSVELMMYSILPLTALVFLFFFFLPNLSFVSCFSLLFFLTKLRILWQLRNSVQPRRKSKQLVKLKKLSTEYFYDKWSTSVKYNEQIIFKILKPSNLTENARDIHRYFSIEYIKNSLS